MPSSMDKPGRPDSDSTDAMNALVPAGEPLAVSAGGEVALPMRPEKKHGPIGMLLAGIGGALYTLGFSAEYVIANIWRAVRLVVGFTVQLLGWLLRRVGGWIAGMFKGLWADLTEPWREFRRKRKLLDRVRERAEKRADTGTGQSRSFAAVSAKNNLRLAVRLLSFALPLLAALALVATVFSLLGMDYALEVRQNGAFLGYVADQSVVENAKGLLRDRIRLAENQEVTDWQLNPTYNIARTDSFTTTQQLVNNILVTNTSDASDLTEAIGVYVDKTLYAVTTEPQQLQEYLDGVLAGFQRTAPEGATVSFKRGFTYDDADDEPVYFTSSVEEIGALIERLGANVSERQDFTADGAMTLDDIAYTHGLTLNTLLARNPAMAEAAGVVLAPPLAGEAAADDAGEATVEAVGGAYVPPPGTVLMIKRAEPFLQVQTSVRVQSFETIPYNTIETETEERVTGVRHTTQQGEEGQREVWDEYIYVDGELDDTVRLDELTVVLKEPVDELIEVGTGELVVMSGAGAGIGGGGGYIFPVPDSPYSSRGFAGGHRGLDINAAGGTAIYACAGGTVTTSGWHYSYGNYIVIDHGGGINTLYAHCSALYVEAGAVVAQGQNIAAVGSTGDSTGNHCHLEVTVNGVRVDPVPYVGYPY